MTTTESDARNKADPPPPPPPPPPTPPAADRRLEEATSGDAVVITVKDDDGDGSGRGSRADVAEEGKEVEKVCRICYLSPDRTLEEGSELVLIGCGCKNELGTAHRHCAETWFRVKGNRCCEICGLNAKNITGEEYERFTEEWHDNRPPSNSGNRNQPDSVSCWRGQPFCNFLMACLVIAFILPWFFRVNMF